MLAGTAFAGAGALNVGFLRFCPEICLSGLDNKADDPEVAAGRRFIRRIRSSWVNPLRECFVGRWRITRPCARRRARRPVGLDRDSI